MIASISTTATTYSITLISICTTDTVTTMVLHVQIRKTKNIIMVIINFGKHKSSLQPLILAKLVTQLALYLGFVSQNV
jgi:hypothetical protein